MLIKEYFIDHWIYHLRHTSFYCRDLWFFLTFSNVVRLRLVFSGTFWIMPNSNWTEIALYSDDKHLIFHPLFCICCLVPLNCYASDVRSRKLNYIYYRKLTPISWSYNECSVKSQLITRPETILRPPVSKFNKISKHIFLEWRVYTNL